MRKLVFLTVILVMGIAVTGCQQSGLTDEDARSLVREEVTRQLATEQLRGIIGQEITKQLGTIDELTVSQLAVVNEEGNEVVSFYTMLNGAGAIALRNYDGRVVAQLLSDSDGNPHFNLLNTYDEFVIWIAADPIGNGQISISNKYGEGTFSAP